MSTTTCVNTNHPLKAVIDTPQTRSRIVVVTTKIAEKTNLWSRGSTHYTTEWIEVESVDVITSAIYLCRHDAMVVLACKSGHGTVNTSFASTRNLRQHEICVTLFEPASTLRQHCF